jgi:pimeloyl-ACP methyl ester carboxylesterase
MHSNGFFRLLREHRTSVIGLLAVLGGLSLSYGAYGEHRLLVVGNRHLSIDCAGLPQGNATVVLMAGGGEPSRNWTKVQAKVAPFARTCTYDPAGSGDSDKTAEPQSADELVEDLHALLETAAEKKPYVLVGHSLAGILARRFATRFHHEVAAFVFVDSSHEEQAWRLHELDPGGPFPSDKLSRMGFFRTSGQRLTFRTELPLIVLARGKPFPRTGQLTEEQFAKWDQIWGAMQKDLATHSPKGQYRCATNSGHFINLDEPELVVQAILDVQPKSQQALQPKRR